MATNNVFRRGQGVASGIDYGLSETDHEGKARSVKPQVLHGDPESVKAVVRSLRCRQRYTAGVVTCVEDLTPEQERQLIREHQAISFPGLDPARIAAVYIRHRDKGLSEIHYWIANIDLATVIRGRSNKGSE